MDALSDPGALIHFGVGLGGGALLTFLGAPGWITFLAFSTVGLVREWWQADFGTLHRHKLIEGWAWGAGSAVGYALVRWAL